MESIEVISVSAPLFLVSATQPCSFCGKENTIVALATKNLEAENEQEEGDGFLLCYIEDLPGEILGELLRRHPNFLIRHSMTADNSYYMTICECGGYYGDYYVQKQLLNQAFQTPDSLRIEKLVSSGNWFIPCGYSQSLSVGDLVDHCNKKGSTP